MKHYIKPIVPKCILETYRFIYYEFSKYNVFYKHCGHKLDFDNPHTFPQKLFYRKYYGNNETMAKYADKIRVREYVKNTIGEKYLIPSYGVFNKITEEDLEKLPQEFVIKSNHGSGEDHLEIVKNKSKRNYQEIVTKMNQSLTLNYGFTAHERYYSLIERNLIVEKYMESENGELVDYKFHCFNNGKMYISVDEGRFGVHRRSVYDENWELTNIKLNGLQPADKRKVPDNFDEMKNVAKMLSDKFDYVRVDLYNIAGQIYFGEISQTPANGLEKIEPNEWSNIWGEQWVLDIDNRELYNIKSGYLLRKLNEIFGIR